MQFIKNENLRNKIMHFKVSCLWFYFLNFEETRIMIKYILTYFLKCLQYYC